MNSRPTPSLRSGAQVQGRVLGEATPGCSHSRGAPASRLPSAGSVCRHVWGLPGSNGLGSATTAAEVLAGRDLTGQVRHSCPHPPRISFTLPLSHRAHQRSYLWCSYTNAQVANRGVGFGTERWTNPKHSRRACTCEYGLHSCQGKSAGVPKRPRERSPSRNPTTCFHPVRPKTLPFAAAAAAPTRRVERRPEATLPAVAPCASNNAEV